MEGKGEAAGGGGAYARTKSAAQQQVSGVQSCPWWNTIQRVALSNGIRYASCMKYDAHPFRRVSATAQFCWRIYHSAIILVKDMGAGRMPRLHEMSVDCRWYGWCTAVYFL